MSFSVTSEPSVEPVSTAELKTHLRITVSDEDTLLGNYVTAARKFLEVQTRRAFITQTIALKLDAFPSDIRLPRSPVQSVSSIQYVDTDGATQTWGSGNYSVDTVSEPASIVPAYNIDYPDTRVIPNAVTVTYVTGFGDATTDVPEDIRLMVRMLAGYFYEKREAASTMTWNEDPLGLRTLIEATQVPEVL